MRETIRRAKSHGVAVGAHPSLSDRQGFGRREMSMPREELANCIIYDDSLGRLGVGPVRMTGLGVDASIREGLFLANQTVGGIRTDRSKVALNYEVPFLHYQSPLCIFNAKVAFAIAPALFSLDVKGGRYLLGLYNTYVASQLTWDLGGGLGVGYQLGGRIATNSEVGYGIGIIEPRAGLSYIGNDWNLTASFQYDMPLLGSKFTGLKFHDFLELNITDVNKFDEWELGAASFGSTHLIFPIFGYKKLGQFAGGGLVYCNFGPVLAQFKVKTDVNKRNYGGRNARA